MRRGCDFDIFHETRWCDVGVTWVRFGRDFGATSISPARQGGVICVWLGCGVGTMLIYLTRQGMGIGCGLGVTWVWRIHISRNSVVWLGCDLGVTQPGLAWPGLA